MTGIRENSLPIWAWPGDIPQWVTIRKALAFSESTGPGPDKANKDNIEKFIPMYSRERILITN